MNIAAGKSIEPARAIAYASSEKASLYEAIMRTFVESRERFVFHLRGREVLHAIRQAHAFELAVLPDQAEIDSALIQLCEWGNLQSQPDTADVFAVEDFQNPRYTFRITPLGEAAERALALLHTASEPEPQLYSNGLADIRNAVLELKQLLQETTPDAAKMQRNLRLIRICFEDVSITAQVLIDRLERRSDLQPPDVRRLIDFGQRFIGELVLESDAIGESLRQIDAAEVVRMIHLPGERNIRTNLGTMSEPDAAVRDPWHVFWERFRNWFVSRPDFPSNAEMLRERGRATMPVLLNTLAQVQDRQKQRFDRAGDFRVLARWFAQAASDAEAHLLWRAAFGLCPARHLTINDATLGEREAQDVPGNTSWLDAPPLRLSKQEREYRTNSMTGGLSRIIDRSAEKEKLAGAADEEAKRLLNAQRRFGIGKRNRLSELERLEADEFELFLDLLGEAVSARVSAADSVEILSGDGCLKVKLEPTRDGREAFILTQDGMFCGPDQWICIEPVSTEEALEVPI